LANSPARVQQGRTLAASQVRSFCLPSFKADRDMRLSTKAPLIDREDACSIRFA
jgi:hypothetical protein